LTGQAVGNEGARIRLESLRFPVWARAG